MFRYVLFSLLSLMIAAGVALSSDVSVCGQERIGLEVGPEDFRGDLLTEISLDSSQFGARECLEKLNRLTRKALCPGCSIGGCQPAPIVDQDPGFEIEAKPWGAICRDPDGDGTWVLNFRCTRCGS